MKKHLGVVLIALVVFANIGTSLTSAQQTQPAPPDRKVMEQERMPAGQPAPTDQIFFERQMGPPEVGGSGGVGMAGDFVFFATEMGFSGKVVKGAPYSAQALTESVQLLSDGNRIVNKSTSGIYRDSEGRTRREQTIKAIGSFANGGDGMQTVFISDPVANTSYSLDPRTHVARKFPPMQFTVKLRSPAPGGEKVEEALLDSRERIAIERDEIVRSKVPMTAAAGPVVWGWGNHEPRNESLGKQNIEGVEAEGSRSTLTIPAGEIGNERAIEIINERWYSNELQTVVMTRHSDPRFGESTYKLTSIDRSEPARSLFEVPADYALKTSSAVGTGSSVGGGAGVGAGSGGGIGFSVGGGPSRGQGGAISGGVLNSKATSMPIPAYPAIAKAAHASGTVTVDVTIDEEGNVTAARAVSGHPLLQSCSVAAARNAKFSPTKLAGQAVKVQGALIYTFEAE